MEEKLPYEGRIVGEPTADNEPANFDRQFDILVGMLEAEHKRSDTIDTKTATLLAGTIAIVGFSLDHANTAEGLSVLLFAWPVWHFYHAYRPIYWKNAPSATDFGYKLAKFPQTTVASGAVAIANVIEHNRPKIEAKAEEQKKGFDKLMLVLIVVVVVRVFFIVTGDLNAQRNNAAPSPTSTRGANAAKPNPTHTKGRENKHSQKVAPATSHATPRTTAT